MKMSKNWTNEQLEAINSPTGNILVSAGAGSGKTAVLTERVITLLNTNIKINELLILTFTKAAAMEMKERIRKAIKKNSKLKEQLDLLDNAYITTFDSFALSIVKKYHYLLGVSSNVKIVNEAALKLEKYKIIDEIMEEKYHSKDIHFTSLIYRFCLKDDQDLKNLFYELNEKFSLIIDKETFLEEFSNSLNEQRIKSLWDFYFNKILEEMTVLQNLYYEIENSLESVEDENLFEKLSLIMEPFINSNDYDVIASNINFNLSSLRNTKNINDTFLNNKKEMSKVRDKIKKMISYPHKKEILEALKENQKYEIEIISIIKEINKRINKLKFDNQMFEFMDIAKLAIKVLKENKDIREEFKDSLKEIMLDEYQDTSDIQEALISLISNNNVYMVGDIKQSIYRFRNANPRIFLDKYNAYLNNQNGKVINLMRNFRSREEVLNDINLLFNEIMVSKLGGIEYSNGHKFIYGNIEYDKNKFSNQSNNLEIYNYDRKKLSSLSFDEIEAFIIAYDIKNKIESNYMIYDKDNNISKKLEYKDITILIDRKTGFETYQKVFEYLKIPLSIYKNNDLTFSNEILCFKNIFKLLLKYKENNFDSEFKHSFMSVGRSFLFEINDNDLFDIISKENYFTNQIYLSLKEIIDNIDYLSLKEIMNKIMEKLDVFYKIAKCNNIEDTSAIIHYLNELVGDLSTLNYDLKKLVEYFEVVISKEFKIELPVRKNSMNSVKIMTIHISKGLEFNICYFAGFNKRFSEFDSKKKFLYDDELGFLLPLFINDEKYKNIGNYYYFDKYYEEEISEKIRLLYVALSRAKEKMIIVGDFSDTKNKKINLNETRSFYDLIKYGESVLNKYYRFIDLTTYNIDPNYKYYRPVNNLFKSTAKKIINKEIKINNHVLERTSFSKKQLNLLDEDTCKLLEKGNELHHILENIDLKNPDLSIYKLKENDLELVKGFLNSPLIKNIKSGKIYQEYEFMYQENDEIKHGFIDLMIVYDNYIDIIDYKLSNINDENYVKQLKGYKNYITYLTNKPVHLYLYSLFKKEYLKIGE